MSHITPEELIAYSVFDKVTSRNTTNLETDIIEAEGDLETQAGIDLDTFVELPERLKIALLKLSEFYALINSDESMIKGIKSENLGDYSYTLSDGQSIQKPDISHLIRKYRAFSGTLRVRMRGI